MYKVIKRFRDTDGRIYEVGDTYEGSMDKERLTVLTTKDNKYNIPFLEQTESDFPQHVGGGWYELSNGERVQGKQEAVEAEEVL